MVELRSNGEVNRNQRIRSYRYTAKRLPLKSTRAPGTQFVLHNLLLSIVSPDLSTFSLFPCLNSLLHPIVLGSDILRILILYSNSNHG